MKRCSYYKYSRYLKKGFLGPLTESSDYSAYSPKLLILQIDVSCLLLLALLSMTHTSHNKFDYRCF